MKFRTATICNYYDRTTKRRIEKIIAVTTKGNLVERFAEDPEGLFFHIPATHLRRRKRKPGK